MKTRALRSVLLAVAAAAVTLSAQQAAPPFRYERPVVTGGAGPRRLAIDVPLLVGAAPFRTAIRAKDPATGAVTVALGDGLRDMRLYDAAGAEIGYLLVTSPAAVPVYKAAAILPVAPVDTDKVKTSGFEADLGEPLPIDRFKVEGVERPFLKRVRLEGSGDRERWTLLVPDGTLFDLPDEQLYQTELRFTPGSY